MQIATDAKTSSKKKKGTGFKKPLRARRTGSYYADGSRGPELDGTGREPHPDHDRGDTVALTADAFETAAEWQDKAACRDTDPALFFPVGTTGPAIDQIASAKSVCHACFSKDACLEFALATNQDTGVWGGTSEDERRVIRRRMRATAGRL